MDIDVPLGSSFIMRLTVEVVDLNVTFLLGLDVLDKYRLYVHTVSNRLVCVNEGVDIPVVGNYGHVYYIWDMATFYSFSELQRIHKHFFHVLPDRLYALMRRAKDKDAVSATLKKLQDLTDACDVCQRHAVAPRRFRVGMPNEDILLNQLVHVDLIWIEGKAALHVVDKDTFLGAAAFLDEGQTTDAVWETFLRIWVTPYIGYPAKMHVDQGSNLTSARWSALAEAAGIKMRASGIESHNSLGAGERYHAVLRDLYQRVRSFHPNIAAKTSLALSVRAMNQIIGPQGLSPMLLVFGVHPRIPVRTEDLPEHRDRAKALVQARADMVKHVSRLRLAAAARQPVPAAADREISAGMRVLVFRERPDLWEGPFTVVDCDNKQVWLDVNGRLKLFSLHQVKEYTPPVNVPAAETASPKAATQAGSASPTSVDPRTNDTAGLGSVIDGIAAGDTLLCRVSRLLGDVQHRLDNTERSGMYITEVLQANDPRAHSPARIKSKKEEVAGLEARRTWAKVQRSSVPNGASIMGGRFVPAIKNPSTEVEKAKARFVLQGHMDKDKPFVVHNVPTPRQSSTRIVVSTSANEGFLLFLHDVNQAYLQSRDALTKPMYLKRRPKDAQFFDLDARPPTQAPAVRLLRSRKLLERDGQGARE